MQPYSLKFQCALCCGCLGRPLAMHLDAGVWLGEVNAELVMLPYAKKEMLVGARSAAGEAGIRAGRGGRQNSATPVSTDHPSHSHVPTGFRPAAGDAAGDAGFRAGRGGCGGRDVALP